MIGLAMGYDYHDVNGSLISIRSLVWMEINGLTYELFFLCTTEDQICEGHVQLGLRRRTF